MSETPEPGRPQLRVVKGEPTPEELAAVTAVVTAAAAAARTTSRAPEQQRGRWADPFDMHRRPWQTGVGGWRAAIR